MNGDIDHVDRYWHPFRSPASRSPFKQMNIVAGEGVYVTDAEGGRYIDGQAGLWCVNVGHGHPRVNQAIREQLDRIAFYNTFIDHSTEPANRLADRMIELTSEEDSAGVLFGSSGSEAMDTALKVARHCWKLRGEPQRTHFISLEHGYHGANFGGTSIGGDPEVFGAPYTPLLPHCSQIPSPFRYRNPWTDDPAEHQLLAERAAERLDEEIQRVGPDRVAAFIAEPVQGAGGVIVPPPGYWPLVREVCDRHGVLLIADEVVTGFGRMGSLLGSRGWGVKPDIMTFAKGLSSGYVPMGATVVGAEVARAWASPAPSPSGAGAVSPSIMHGYTYGGHALGAAAALASLDVVVDDDLPANAATVGAAMLERLAQYPDRFPVVGDVRGKGLMMAVELVADRATKEPVPTMFSRTVQTHIFRHGAIVRASGHKLIISPPLIITMDEAMQLLDALEAGLTAAS